MNAQWWVCPRPSTMLLGPAGVPLSPTPSDPPKILFNTIRLLSSWEFHHIIILCRKRWTHSINFNHIPRIPEVRSGWTKKGCFIWEWIGWLAWIPPTNMYNISPLCNLMSPCLLLNHACNPYFGLVFPSTNLQKLFKHALCPICVYVNPTKMSLKHMKNHWKMLYMPFWFKPYYNVIKTHEKPLKSHEKPWATPARTCRWSIRPLASTRPAPKQRRRSTRPMWRQRAMPLRRQWVAVFSNNDWGVDHQRMGIELDWTNKHGISYDRKTYDRMEF